MITFARSADIRDGKQQPAIAWALKVAAYVNDNLGTNFQVMINVAGKINQLHWVGTFDSLASFDASAGKINNDAGYQELLAEGTSEELFFANTLMDRLFRTVP